MQNFAFILLLIVGFKADPTDSTKLHTIADAYIQWTQLGGLHPIQSIFSPDVQLTYQIGDGDRFTVSFVDYEQKVTHAATAFPRCMHVQSIELSNEIGKAVIVDDGETFALEHLLTLVKENGTWQIQSILLASP